MKRSSLFHNNSSFTAPVFNQLSPNFKKIATSLNFSIRIWINTADAMVRGIKDGFFIDYSRCFGCNQCTIACMQWHDIPPGPVKWMRVYRCETGNFTKYKV